MVLTRHAEAEGPRWAADGRLLAEGTELGMNDRNYHAYPVAPLGPLW